MISITRPLPLALLIGLAVGIAIGVAVTAIAAAQAPPGPQPAGDAPAAATPAEVRITARLLENGKVEFGLQQRTGDSWGEIMLPRVNKFPYARATVDRWLYSSPLTVTGVATATGAWQRDGRHGDTYWRLDGVGTFTPASRAGERRRAFPELELSCTWSLDGSAHLPAAIVRTGASYSPQHPLGGFQGVHYHALGDETWEGFWAEGWFSESTTPMVFSRSPFRVRDWLTETYAHSPIVVLTAEAGSAVQFRGTFDLTGLPTVLADLPCYGLDE